MKNWDLLNYIFKSHNIPDDYKKEKKTQTNNYRPVAPYIYKMKICIAKWINNKWPLKANNETSEFQARSAKWRRIADNLSVMKYFVE